MRYTQEDLRDNVIRLRAQVAALLEFLQKTPIREGKCMLDDMKSWERYQEMCQFQEEKIRKGIIL